MTIILICHKVSLNVCDYIYLIKEGTISDKGTFEYLKNNSTYFKELRS